MKTTLKMLMATAIFAASVAAQAPETPKDAPKTEPAKTETPLKPREFLWGTTPTDVGELAPMFDGKSLDGWVSRGGGKFGVENGELVGETGDGRHGWLTSARTYGDFVMELDLKNEGGNSGIQIRSHLNDKDVMVGLQIEVDPTSTAIDPKVRAWSGGLYEQGRRAWLQSVVDHPEGKKLSKSVTGITIALKPSQTASAPGSTACRLPITSIQWTSKASSHCKSTPVKVARCAGRT